LEIGQCREVLSGVVGCGGVAKAKLLRAIQDRWRRVTCLIKQANADGDPAEDESTRFPKRLVADNKGALQVSTD
jgi:hypothetical protein